jgi:C4-dicarboxylate-specific signal transduction histidine kinase
MFHLVPPCLTGRFKVMLILSTCRKRSQMHKQIQLPSSLLPPLQLQRFHQQSQTQSLCHLSTKSKTGLTLNVQPRRLPLHSSSIPQDYTNGLSLLTGSVILAMICAIFAGVVLAIFLFYRRKILHYGVEKVDKNVEKERRMSLVLTLQPSGSRPNQSTI